MQRLYHEVYWVYMNNTRFWIIALALVLATAIGTTAFAKEAVDRGMSQGEMHKSMVAEAVHELLDTAERDGGIGGEVKEIANEQQMLHNSIAEKMDRVAGKSQWSVFLFGSDYRSLGELRSSLVTSENGLDRLSVARDRAHPTLQDTIDAQIKALEAENAHAREFLDTHESTFSLFGWLAKYFAE